MAPASCLPGPKTYEAQYRKDGRTRRVSIGRHGKITVAEERKLAKELVGQVARGVNPAEEIAQHRRASTVAALCERFFDTHIKEHAVSRLPKGNIAGLVTFSRIQPSAASK
ncbi:Arm DNA-binding domain-containing protein [Ruegeria sp.]|uniref:Arm DNA-binding domain-containing protein n=1 Tax=Ruegeria sp. TaxID=1879320 RepID=UPI003AFFD498